MEDYGIKPKNRLKREQVLIREFKRYYHLYSSFVPHSDDTLTTNFDAAFWCADASAGFHLLVLRSVVFRR